MGTHGSSPCPGSERLTLHLYDPSGCEYVTARVGRPACRQGRTCLRPVYPSGIRRRSQYRTDAGQNATTARIRVSALAQVGSGRVDSLLSASKLLDRYITCLACLT